MKDNARYRKSSTVIELVPQMYEDATPMTVRGTAALVDRFHAMKRMGVGVGGAPARGGSTTLVSSGPKKSKSLAAEKKEKAISLTVIYA